MQKLIRKNTWIGLGVAMGVLLAGIALGATLINRDVLNTERQDIYLTVVCGIAALSGGFVAAKGKEQHLARSMAATAIFYLTLWIFTFAADGKVVFDTHALRTTISVFFGGVAGSLAVPRKERKHSGKKGSIPAAKRRGHAVT